MDIFLHNFVKPPHKLCFFKGSIELSNWAYVELVVVAYVTSYVILLQT